MQYAAADYTACTIKYYTARLFQDVGNKVLWTETLSLSRLKHVKKVDGVVCTIGMPRFWHIESLRLLAS